MGSVNTHLVSEFLKTNFLGQVFNGLAISTCSLCTGALVCVAGTMHQQHENRKETEYQAVSNTSRLHSVFFFPVTQRNPSLKSFLANLHTHHMQYKDMDPHSQLARKAEI